MVVFDRRGRIDGPSWTRKTKHAQSHNGNALFIFNFILAPLLHGSTQNTLTKVTQGHVLELWRLLVQDHEPKQAAGWDCFGSC